MRYFIYGILKVFLIIKHGKLQQINGTMELKLHCEIVR